MSRIADAFRSPGGAGVAACPTREGASDNLAPGSAGGTTVNKEGGRVGGRHKGMTVSQRFEEILAPEENSASARKIVGRQRLAPSPVRNARALCRDPEDTHGRRSLRAVH